VSARKAATAGAPPAGKADKEPQAKLDDLVWQELRSCFDPEIPVNIVDLGLIYAMHTEVLPEGGYRVEVLMTVTSPACGMSETLREDADTRIRRLPGVKQVEIAVTFDPPWTPELMSEDARLLLNL
jgi:metal-sulfur cluster biosynthetic enzyme